jgi:hypothetical protein
MNRILNKFAVGAVLLGFTLGGCGGNNETAPDASQVTAAVRASAHESEPGYSDDQMVQRFTTLLNQLRDVPALAPLFDQYQVPNPIVMVDDSQATGLIALLQAVKITVASGTVTIANRQTSGVIFSAPLTDLASGVFHPENMPSGAAPSPCTYTYSAWGACQADGTQTRTVASSTPAGCTGTPVLSQACSTTPPPPPPPPPATCTSFTYSPWAACQSNGTQTRTVLSSSPTGCTGGSPVLSQSCTYTPPVTNCTAFTYSTWGACQPDGTQSRTIISSSPTGCTGGSPVLSQSCTYTPPVTTCSSFTYSAWGACQTNGTQTRTVLTSSPSGCTGGSPVLSQACTYVPPTCSSFTYSAWGACQSNNTQTRTVVSSSPSGCTGGSPVLSQACTYVPPTCSSFTYSAWGACQSNNTQTRTVVSSSPSGCTGGTPVLTQACTYTPPAPDGAALYGQYCAGCHGALASSNLKGKGISVSLIKSFNMTQGLNDTQLQAIVTAVGP